MDYFEQLIILCPLIFISGLIDSIAGGGGLISLPAYNVAGLTPHFALGTNKFSSCIGTLFSTMRFVKNKSYNLTSAIPSVIFALISSAIGAKIAVYMEAKILQYILIAGVPIIAMIIFKKKNLTAVTPKHLSKGRIIFLSSVIGFVIGGYDGFFGPGTGTFLILAYTSVLGFDLLTSMGNAKLVNLTSNLASLAVFLIEGKILFVVGIPAALCAIAGHYIGSGLAIKNGQKIVRPILILVLTLLMIKLIWDLVI
ncbi:TSUP family transporter [Bacteroides sp. 519]|uniref:TSUP family transporter n=1 Tax=Bacteroides sp. 519 TaxID=2302937 RepID=UPI0013D2AD16|nr:TSUP family transporter [Bacteroides sp. 519]NDV60084.1 sulfite exporter TauE/SafE family protein [Bacteroides sp. 519]